MVNQTIKWMKKNIVIIGFFLASTFFFLYYFQRNISWDFSVYILNAQYWFSDGSYFEIMRPPLVSFILGMLGLLFGWKLTPYIFIIGVSLLFLYASLKLSKAVNMDAKIFYVLSLSPAFLVYSFAGGAELLSLCFLGLFLASLIQNKNSGHYLALASLTRYNFIIFLPLLLFQKKRKLFADIFIFFAALFPWAIYNLIKTGNILTSFADSYAINIKFRTDVFQQINFLDLFYFISYLTPFFLIGVFLAIRKTNSKNFDKRTIAIFAFFSVLALYQFIKIPLKENRYLFPLILPITYFSIITISEIKKENLRKLLILLVIFLSLALTTHHLWSEPRENSKKYENAVIKLKELNIISCRTFSDNWPILTYHGKTAEPMPWEDIAYKKIEDGDIAVLFNKKWENNILYEGESFVIVGKDKCNPERKVDNSYLQLLNETYYFYKKPLDIGPCSVIFDNKLLKKTCNLLN